MLGDRLAGEDPIQTLRLLPAVPVRPLLARVPELALVSRLQALMHTGRLRMPDSLPFAKTLRRELLDFRVTYTAVGNATFGAREGAHDDPVLAVALAVYGLDGGREAIIEPLRVR
jgi:hypothetical protein